MKKTAQTVLLFLGISALLCIGFPLSRDGEEGTVYAAASDSAKQETSDIHQEVLPNEHFLVIAPEEANPMEACLAELSRYPLDHLGMSSHVGNDYNVLLKIVEAEAGGEKMRGKILVANVILNRVESPEFPDNVEAVVYQVSGGSPQFTPTVDGRIDSVTVSDATVDAVNRALSGEDYSEGALYFLARSHSETSNVSWFDRHLTKLFSFGGHDFYS